MTCASTVRSVTNSRAAIARFDMPSATSPRTSRSRSVSPFEGIGPAAPAQETGDDRRVDDRFPVHDPAEGVDHGRDVEHPFLEQIPDPFGMILDEAHGIARFDVLGQDQDANLRMVRPYRPGRDEALVGVCRGHLDIHDGHVRSRLADFSQQGVGVFRLGDDLDSRVPQQPDDPLPGEHDVFGHDYPHGICAPIHVGSMVRMPSSAPTRSAIPLIGEVRPWPSSSTVTVRRPSRCATVTAA